MKRLIYLKNGQSLDLVSPLKLSSHDFVDHVAHGFKTKKKKEYKDDFFLNNIDSVAMQPVLIHFCTHETENNIQSLVVCVMQKYRLL